MSKKQFVVRVVQTSNPGDPANQQPPYSVNEGGVINGNLLECLRYAGHIELHDVDPNGLTELCFDIRCPTYRLNSQTWSEQLAAKMRSHGFNAVSAPAASDPKDDAPEPAVTIDPNEPVSLSKVVTDYASDVQYENGPTWWKTDDYRGDPFTILHDIACYAWAICAKMVDHQGNVIVTGDIDQDPTEALAAIAYAVGNCPDFPVHIISYCRRYWLVAQLKKVNNDRHRQGSEVHGYKVKRGKHNVIILELGPERHTFADEELCALWLIGIEK